MATPVHPIFEECSHFTTDPFWREQFLNFAANRFPPGMKYDPNHHNIVMKLETRRTEVIALPENTDDPKSKGEMYQIMMNIMRTKLGLKSTKDIQLQRDEIKTAMLARSTATTEATDFKKIKLRNVKDNLIMTYLLQLRHDYKLTPSEFRHLVATVRLGFQFRAISNDDVHYIDGKITSLEGLTWDAKARSFRTRPYPNASHKSERHATPNKFQVLLDKFLKENKARVARFLVS